MKSRTLIDIKGSQGLKKNKNPIINLSCQRVISIPLKSLFKTVFVLLIILSFIFGSVTAPTLNGVKAAQSNDEERKVLESQLVDLENQISQYETTIKQYKSQGTNLQSEIKRLENQIAKLNLQIKAVNLTLTKLDQEINSTKAQITETENNITLNKKNLAQLLQALYENDKKGLIEVLLKNPQLSDFFNDLNNLLTIQDNLRVVIDQIIEARQKLIDQKETLALERLDVAATKSYQDVQKSSIQKTQAEKSSLLKVTKGKESEYQKLLAETKKTAAEIRKQIFKMLGGGELEFGYAYKLAKFAEQATGVRAALILAVLDRESALGKNVGGCDYRTAMRPKEIPIFLDIVQRLDLMQNLQSGVIKVSCPNTDGTYGGAMGPAQFIPSTWKIYEANIAEITGGNPASPWKNADAFVATALYLKDAGAGNGASLAKEREAAARYYAGSRWKSYLWTYGERVIAQAQQFEEDINILNS